MRPLCIVCSIFLQAMPSLPCPQVWQSSMPRRTAWRPYQQACWQAGSCGRQPAYGMERIECSESDLEVDPGGTNGMRLLQGCCTKNSFGRKSALAVRTWGINPQQGLGTRRSHVCQQP